MGTPEDPISPLREGALALYQMFEELMAAGFTEAQALYIVSRSFAGGSDPGR
jgi:hypothetical protein